MVAKQVVVAINPWKLERIGVLGAWTLMHKEQRLLNIANVEHCYTESIALAMLSANCTACH